MPVKLDRRAFVGLGLLWLGSVRAAAAQDEIDIRGVWSSVLRTDDKGASGEQMIFTSKNATLTSGVLLDGTYTIDGSRITITPKDERQGSTEVAEFKIAGSKLLLRGPHLSRMIMTRDGKIRFGADPIVGAWIFPFSFLGYELRIVRRFSRNGATQLALPLDIDYGPYRIVGDTMQLELVRSGKLSVRNVTLTVKREGNLLITRDQDGNEKQFVKFEYDRLQA